MCAGPGGVGKTSLALAAAHAAADQFADGAAFVSLETLTDISLIRDTVTQQLRVPALPGQAIDDSLLAFFGPRQMLLLVDNVERLVAAAPLAEQALERAPRLKILATSREPLRLRGERVVPVAPLALPEASALVGLGTLAAVPAVAFFLTCARDAAAAEESAVEMFRSAGERRWLSYGLALLARVRTGQERLAEAQALLEEARAVWSQVEVTYRQPFDAYLRYYLGSAALVRGDLGTARVHLEASLRDLEAAEDDTARGVVLGSIGLIAAQRSEHADARTRFAEGLPLLHRGVDLWDLALLLLNSGLEEAQAASPMAGVPLTDALRAWQQLRGGAGMAFALAGLGELAAGGQPHRAGRRPQGR